jgi:SET domain-containing protein
VGQDSLLIRTPLGGFINEDKDDPNCTKRIVNESGLSTYYLVALRHIEGGEELTLKYDLSKSD